MPETLTDSPVTLFNVRTATTSEIDAAQAIAGYTQELKLSSTAGPVYAEHVDGSSSEIYRFASVFQIRPEERRFQIVLRPGASRYDLAFARAQVELMFRGHLWQFPWQDTHDSEGHLVHRLELGERLQERGHLARESFAYEHCEVEGCLDAMHEISSDRSVMHVMHTAMKVDAKLAHVFVQRFDYFDDEIDRAPGGST